MRGERVQQRNVLLGRVTDRPGELPGDHVAEQAAGLDLGPAVRQPAGPRPQRLVRWAVSYPAEEYIGLLDTFSSHIALAPWQRDRLYGEVWRRLAARPGGRLLRHWGAVLHVARRLGRAAG